jgi:branched-chain amino acid transport system permease protein
VTTALQTIIDATALGSLYALLALGLAVVFSVMRLINFAFGELVMVAGYTLYLCAALPLALAALCAIVAAAVTAVIMERVAFRPIRQASPTSMLVTSFALSVLLQNVALLFFGGRARTVDIAPWLTRQVQVGGQPVAVIDVVTIVVAAALTTALAVILRRTRLGLQMRAAAIDFDMARALGVRANRIMAVAFAVSGTLAGGAAVLIVAQSGTVTPQMGLLPVLVAFVSVVIGGMSRLSAAALGGFVIGCLTIVLQTALPESLRAFRDAFLFSVVIVVLLLRPHGLFAPREVERV